MKTQLQKWGNSLAIRIPRDVVRKAKFRQGEVLELEINRPGSLRVRATKKRRRTTLAQLLKRITKQNLHSEVEWGRAQGNEVW